MTGTGVPTLNRNDIHKFRIHLPEVPDQIGISNKIDNVNILLNETQEKLNQSKSLQKSLINQVFWKCFCIKKSKIK